MSDPMWLPWTSKRRRDEPKTSGVSRSPEPDFVRISRTPDLAEAPAVDEPEDAAALAAASEDEHAPDIPDPQDPLLYLDFGFDGRIPVGIDLSFPSQPAADPEEALGHCEALLDAGLAFAARRLLAQVAEPAASAARARRLRALLLWGRFRNAEERHRRGWACDLLCDPTPLWLRDAEALLHGAVETEPGFGPAWLALAEIHLETKGGAEPSRTIEEARRACELLGGAPAALLALGRALRAGGRPGDALAAFARIPAGAGELAAAEREAELARLEARCLTEPVDVAAHLALGRWCLRHDRRERTRELFAQLMELRPDRPEGFWGLGRLALGEPGKSWDERLAEARRLALAALSRKPELGLADELLGIVHHNLRFAAAGPGFPREDPIPLFRRAVELDPTCDQALVSLAEDHVGRGEIEPAIARLEEAVGQETRSAFAYRLLALLYECTRRDDQLDRALAFRQQADDLEPHTALAPEFEERVRRLCHYEI